MIYLAGPYTHPNMDVRVTRYRELTYVAYQFIKAGVPVYSPITHNHPLAGLGDLPTGWDFWGQFDRLHLRNCSMLVVLTMDGWEDSKGVTAEINIARELGLPIHYTCLEEIERVIEFFKTLTAQPNKEEVAS